MNIDYSYVLVVSHATLHDSVFAPIAFSFYYKSLALCRGRNLLMTDWVDFYDCGRHNLRVSRLGKTQVISTRDTKFNEMGTNRCAMQFNRGINTENEY